MTLLVTGASGFLGQALIPSLAVRGLQGYAVSRSAIRSLPPGWSWLSRDRFKSGSALLRNAEGCDGFIHLEVKQHVPRPTIEDICEFEEVNVRGTAQWLNWCSNLGVKRFVYFSSIKAVCAGEHQQAENASGPHSSPYGKSKWKAERLVINWANEDTDRSVLILRPAVVYGPGNAANVFAMVDSLAKKRFYLIGRKDNIKSLVSIENLCSAVVYLLLRMKPGVEIYNIVD